MSSLYKRMKLLRGLAIATFCLTALGLVTSLHAQTDVLAVANKASRTIQLIDFATGRTLRSIGTYGIVGGLAVDESIQVFYYTDESCLYRVSFSGGRSEKIGMLDGDATTAWGLAFDASNRKLFGSGPTGIFCVDVNNARTAHVFDPPGNHSMGAIAIDAKTGELFVCDDRGSDGPGIYRCELELGIYELVSNYLEDLLDSGTPDVDGLVVRNGIAWLLEDGESTKDLILEYDLISKQTIRSFSVPYSFLRQGDNPSPTNSAAAFVSIPKYSIPIQGKSVPELALLDDAMLELMTRRDIGGGVLAVSIDGVPVYHRAFGWSDETREKHLEPDAIMRVGSVSKSFTAAAVRSLISDGLLGIDERLMDILDIEPFGSNIDPRIEDITIEDLLLHESGLTRNGVDGDQRLDVEAADAMGIPCPPDRHDLARFVLGKPLSFEPGTRFGYSNVGYMLLGLVVEQVSGMDYMSYLQANVLTPINIPDSQVIHGRTILGEQDYREPFYNHQGLTISNVYYPAYSNAPTAFRPYGRTNLESVAAQGALVAHPMAVLRLLDNHYISKENKGELLNGVSHEGEQRGLMNGTEAIARQRDDGINFVVIFNKHARYAEPLPNTDTYRFSKDIRNQLDAIFDVLGPIPVPDVRQTPVQVTRVYPPRRTNDFDEILEESDDDYLELFHGSYRTIELVSTSPVGSPTAIQFLLEDRIETKSSLQRVVQIRNRRTARWQTLQRTSFRSIGSDTESGFAVPGELSDFMSIEKKFEIRVTYQGAGEAYIDNACVLFE